jgi:hypothetical protein
MQSSFRVLEKFWYFTNIVSDILEGSKVGPRVDPHVGSQRRPEERWSILLGQAHQPPEAQSANP